VKIGTIFFKGENSQPGGRAVLFGKINTMLKLKRELVIQYMLPAC